MHGIKQATIKKIIRRKLDYWLDTITDNHVKEIAKENVIVCGGAITSLLLGEKPNDYDLYFKTFDSVKKIAEYYANKFNESNKIKAVNKYIVNVKIIPFTNINDEVEDRVVMYMQSAGVAAEKQTRYEYFEGLSEADTENFADSLTEQSFNDLENKPETVIDNVIEELKIKQPYRPIFISDNAITLANQTQLIIRFYGAPSDIFKNFDFVHAQCYYDLKANHLECSQAALSTILSKTLIYNGSLYPIASIFRIRKFLNRGWRISAGQLLKIIWQVNKLDMNDRSTLRDQLIGVDQAYMHQLICAIEKQGAKVDGTYIASLLDQIFDE